MDHDIPPVQKRHPEEAVKTLVGPAQKWTSSSSFPPPFQSSSDVARPPPPPNDDSVEFRRGVTIVYVSRTHSQLQQVISELKATAYTPRASIVGSRKQLCVNEWVAEAAKKMGDGNKRGAEKLCKIACESEKCDKKRNVGIYMKETFGIDIAENTTWGKNAFAKGVGGFGDDGV